MLIVHEEWINEKNKRQRCNSYWWFRSGIFLFIAHTQRERAHAKRITRLAFSFKGLWYFRRQFKNLTDAILYTVLFLFCFNQHKQNATQKKRTKYLMLTILEMLLCYLNRCQTVDKGPNHSIRLECDGWCCWLTSWIQLFLFFLVLFVFVVYYYDRVSTEGNGKWRFSHVYRAWEKKILNFADRNESSLFVSVFESFIVCCMRVQIKGVNYLTNSKSYKFFFLWLQSELET